MAGFVWLFISLAAIIGGYIIIDYQKNKLKWRVKNNRHDEEVTELRKIILHMKKRIENLEAIAAVVPDEFNMTDTNPLNRIEITDRNSIKNEHEQTVAGLAKNKGE